MGASCSQRMLSLWLRRLPTDRIARSRDASHLSFRGVRRSPKGEGGRTRKSRTAGCGSHGFRARGLTPASRNDEESAGRGKERAPLAITGKRGNADVLTAVDDAAERLGPYARPGAGAGARHASRARRGRGRRRSGRRAARAESPTGACAIRRWWRSMRPTGCCSTSAAARIFTAARTRWSADLSGRLEAAGFAYRMAIAGTIGAAHAAAHYGEPGR